VILDTVFIANRSSVINAHIKGLGKGECRDVHFGHLNFICQFSVDKQFPDTTRDPPDRASSFHKIELDINRSCSQFGWFKGVIVPIVIIVIIIDLVVLDEKCVTSGETTTGNYYAFLFTGQV